MKKTRFTVNFILAVMFTQTANAGLDAARQSELLYFIKHDCGSCHGMTLKGGLGPALLPSTLSAKPKPYLINTILNGRENTAMPPWKPMLTIEEATWITEQLQTGLIESTQIADNKNTVSQP